MNGPPLRLAQVVEDVVNTGQTHWGDIRRAECWVGTGTGPLGRMQALGIGRSEANFFHFLFLGPIFISPKKFILGHTKQSPPWTKILGTGKNDIKIDLVHRLFNIEEKHPLTKMLKIRIRWSPDLIPLVRENNS